MLSVWDVTPEKSDCVAAIQTHMTNYTHTCEVLQEQQSVLIGLATGAHDTYVYLRFVPRLIRANEVNRDQADAGQFSVFKIDFPPMHTGVSIAQVLDVKIDVPITGLFLEVTNRNYFIYSVY